MKKAFFISVIALSPLLLAIMPTNDSEQKEEEVKVSTTEQTGQAESKGSEHPETAEGTAGSECKEGDVAGPDGKCTPKDSDKEENPDHHASCGCGY